MALLLLALAAASCARHVPPPPAMTDAGRACLAALDRRGVAYDPAPIAAASSSCTIDNPVRVRAAAVEWKEPGIVACRFALALDDFAREDVAPLALRYFRRGVVEMRNFGTYACRTTRAGRESLHAEGAAIDVASFVLEDGTVISVLRDWKSAGPKGRFLHDVARAACRRFSMVLTPDSDRDHYNHIHLDIGRYRGCGAGF
jgi:hypothetical protein